MGRMNKDQYEALVRQQADVRFGSVDADSEMVKVGWIGAMLHAWPLVAATHEYLYGDQMNAMLFMEIWLRENAMLAEPTPA